MISAIVSYEDGRVSIHSAGVKHVGVNFEPGFYSAYTDSNGNMNITEEKLEELHNPYKTKENEIVMSVVNAFFTEEMYKKINSLGFVHKLGILLYGKAGVAKTSLMNFIAQKLISEKGAVVFFCSNANELTTATTLAKAVREIQDTPIVFIADEFEKYAKEGESEMKNLLDGNKSVQNSLFLAATNYIDEIPDTLKNRPSRFKIVLELKGITDKKLMRKVLKNISNRISPSLFTKEEIDAVVKDIDSITLDELKHKCLDKASNSYIPEKFKENIRPTIGFNRAEANNNGIDFDDDDDYPGEQRSVFSINISELFKNKSTKETNTNSNI